MNLPMEIIRAIRDPNINESVALIILEEYVVRCLSPLQEENNLLKERLKEFEQKEMARFKLSQN